jgi:hypothetical protein
LALVAAVILHHDENRNIAAHGRFKIHVFHELVAIRRRRTSGPPASHGTPSKSPSRFAAESMDRGFVAIRAGTLSLALSPRRGHDGISGSSWTVWHLNG